MSCVQEQCHVQLFCDMMMHKFTRCIIWYDSDANILVQRFTNASIDVSLMQRFWCTNSDVMIKKCDNAQVLGKRERDGTKVGEMQISRESTRRVHRCPASPSHHFRILSNSYRASELHKIASCVCGPRVTRFPSYLWQLGKNYFMCSFSIWKKVQKQDNQRRDNADRI